MALQGSKVMYQRCAETLVTEEPDEGNLHVRNCGDCDTRSHGVAVMQEEFLT